MLRLLSVIRERWQGETDGAGLGLVRILVAASVLMEMLRVWFTGGVTDLLINLQFHFKYTLFSWVGPPQGMMPAVFVWALAVVAALVLVGWRIRWTAPLMAAGYVYWFLIDAANYSDHGYLLCLMSILVAWLPTNRWASIDAYMGREQRTQVPAWCVELVRVQLALVYFFFAKGMLSSDWLSGSPLVAWSAIETDSPFAVLLANRPGLVSALAWLIPVLYVAAIPGLWWKWSRPIALVGLAAFHVWDAFAYQLTVSPWLLTGLNLVFCDGARWRRWSTWVVNAIPRWSILDWGWRWVCRLGLVLDRCVSWFDDTPLVGDKQTRIKAYVEPVRPVGPPTTFPAAARYAVLAWLLLQCWLPVRHVTIERRPDWTDLTTMFSWRGQHRDKQCDLKLSVVQPSQELRWPLEPTEDFPVPLAIFYTAERLEKMGLSEGTLKDLVSAPVETRAARFAAFKVSPAEAERIVGLATATMALRLSEGQDEQMVQRPEFVRQYALHLKSVLSRLLDEEVDVDADLQVRLNFRPAQKLLKEGDFDLTAVRSVNELAEKLPQLSEQLPPVPEQVLIAKGLAERRRFELEQDFDVVQDKNRGPGEPAKLPPISDEDERWFQEKFVKRK